MVTIKTFTIVYIKINHMKIKDKELNILQKEIEHILDSGHQ